MRQLNERRQDSAIDGSVPDNAIEERVAKAERLLT